jgi:drug/metabolite transporter (DMT)-like permease
VAASIGQIFLTKAFAAGDPAKVSVVSLSQVVFALIFDLFLKQPVDAVMIVGIVLIVVPTAWVMSKSR